MTSELLLDPQLKYWVLLPISVVMVVVGLLRSNLTYYLTSSKKLPEVKISRERQFLQRAVNFRENNRMISKHSFDQRQKYYLEKLNSNEFIAESEANNEPATNPLADPKMNEQMMGMLKGNMMNYIPQTLVMGWINYFFPGFVIMKLPFTLTTGFKQMLQSDVMTPDLNVRYVSAISWYFINFMGLKPVYSLLVGSESAEELMAQQHQQQQMNFTGPGGPKADRLFKGEAENIQILSHVAVFDDIIDRILKIDI